MGVIDNGNIGEHAMFDKLIARLARMIVNNARVSRAIRRADLDREIKETRSHLASNLAAIAECEAGGNFGYTLGYERVAYQRARLEELTLERATI